MEYEEILKHLRLLTRIENNPLRFIAKELKKGTLNRTWSQSENEAMIDFLWGQIRYIKMFE